MNASRRAPALVAVAATIAGCTSLVGNFYVGDAGEYSPVADADFTHARAGPLEPDGQTADGAEASDGTSSFDREESTGTDAGFEEDAQAIEATILPDTGCPAALAGGCICLSSDDCADANTGAGPVACCLLLPRPGTSDVPGTFAAACSGLSATYPTCESFYAQDPMPIAGAQLCRSSADCENGLPCIAQTCTLSDDGGTIVVNLCGLMTTAPFSCTAN